jgi:hypothetical protein
VLGKGDEKFTVKEAKDSRKGILVIRKGSEGTEEGN